MAEELESLLNNADIYLEIYQEKRPVYLRIKEIDQKEVKDSDVIFVYEKRVYTLEITNDVEFIDTRDTHLSPRAPLEFKKIFQAAVAYTGTAREVELRTQANANYPSVLIKHSAWEKLNYADLPSIAKQILDNKHQGTYTLCAKFL